MTGCRVRVRSKVKPYFRGVLRLATAATLLYAGVAGMAQAGLAQVSPRLLPPEVPAPAKNIRSSR
jgi:hypothetical protein